MIDYDKKERLEKLLNSNDPLKLIFMWVKQGVIGLPEYRKLVNRVTTPIIL
jgi:hypothetical protein